MLSEDDHICVVFPSMTADKQHGHRADKSCQSFYR